MILIFNLVGFAWAMIAGIVGMGVAMLLGYPPGTTNQVAVGFTLFVCDFAYRFLQGDPFELKQLIRRKEGGHVLFIPCWILGLLLCVTQVWA
ncbi:MAG: hypothetical protein ACJ8CR_35865 [Roseiflexaceae bacterium]